MHRLKFTRLFAAVLACAAGCGDDEKPKVMNPDGGPSNPACFISQPTRSTLNGVPAAMGGDRVSPDGDYRVAFEVTTTGADGQTVQLEITPPGGGAKSTLTATSMNGRAAFPTVALTPDGTFTVGATCAPATGPKQTATARSFTVDTKAPALTVTEPMAGKRFTMAELNMGKFRVCGSTTDNDAANVSTTSPSMGNNLCATIGAASPVCGRVMGTNGGSGCVELACPGSTAFELSVALSDSAGNVTRSTVANLACPAGTTTGGVAIVSPTGDVAPFADPAKRLLASTATQAFKDLDARVPGAQTNVVACSDKGGKATLLTGIQGTMLSTEGMEVNLAPAQASDNCPAGLGFVARFNNVTLPQSLEESDGRLKSPTQLIVQVGDNAQNRSQSMPVNIWVDSVAPVVTEPITRPLCGHVQSTKMDWTTELRLGSTSEMITLVLMGPAGRMELRPMSVMNGLANFGMVTFRPGDTQVSAVATEPAGNTGALVAPCLVRVGDIPAVTFEAPSFGQNLCAMGNTAQTCLPDTGPASGWQGTLRVRVEYLGTPVTAGTVTFTASNMMLGTANIGANGIAELPMISIADGPQVTLTATTAGLTTMQQGTVSRTVIVDTVAPGPLVNLMASVRARRAGTFRLTWNAPADATSYLVRAAKAAITPETLDAMTETIAYAGGSAGAGMQDYVDVANRNLETPYFFAVAALDAVGNRGPVAVAGPTTASFNRTELRAPMGGGMTENFGASIDGPSDLNGDGRSDILVGALGGQRAFIFFGKEAPAQGDTPDVTISGPAMGSFGQQFIDVGDIDKDGRTDLAVSAPRLRRVYIYKGRAMWPRALTDADADYAIEFDMSYNGSLVGAAMAKLGDFNGDGVDDFGLGAPLFNMQRGRVVVVLGRAGFNATMLNTIVFDGDPMEPMGRFGGDLIGIGKFYTAAPGTTMVVSAGGAGMGRGRVYAFQGVTGTAGMFTAAMAQHFTEGPAAGAARIEYGTTLTLLGPLAGSSAALAIGTNLAAPGIGNGFFDVFAGTQMMGPFSGLVTRLINERAIQAIDQFARVVAGGAFSGSSDLVSLIGDQTPDILATSQTENGKGPRIYIINGAKLGTLPKPTADIFANADVAIPLPEDWRGVTSRNRVLLRDVNGDGFADFALSEGSVEVMGRPGRTFLFW